MIVVSFYFLNHKKKDFNRSFDLSTVPLKFKESSFEQKENSLNKKKIHLNENRETMIKVIMNNMEKEALKEEHKIAVN